MSPTPAWTAASYLQADTVLVQSRRIIVAHEERNILARMSLAVLERLQTLCVNSWKYKIYMAGMSQNNDMLLSGTSKVRWPLDPCCPRSSQCLWSQVCCLARSLPLWAAPPCFSHFCQPSICMMDSIARLQCFLGHMARYAQAHVHGASNAWGDRNPGSQAGHKATKRCTSRQAEAAGYLAGPSVQAPCLCLW